jgi:uncharacterized protein YqcC (DUF446 family)
VTDDQTRVRAGDLADAIEAGLRRAGGWFEPPPSEAQVLAGGAFGTASVPFEAWIQVVLLNRLRQVARGEMDLPSSSSVGAHAVREWDGAPDRDELIDLLIEVDHLA